MRGLYGKGDFTVAADSGDDSEKVKAHSGQTDLVIVVRSGATIAGRILGPDGAAVSERGEVLAASARVPGPPDPSAVRTSSIGANISDGKFEIKSVPPGVWSISADVAGWGKSPAVSVTVKAHEQLTVDLKLGPRVMIRGRLVDEHGRPVRGARVSAAGNRSDALGGGGGALDWNAAVRSNAQGSFVVGTSAGEQRLFVYHPEFQPVLLPVNVADDGIDLGTITLHSGEGTSAVFEFSGIGAVISRADDGHYVVADLIKGGPAERAGVRPKDGVVAVDGVPADSLSMQDLISRIRGPVGTTVTLDLARAGNPEPLRLDIVREKIQT